jgi:hypothetical protein
MRRLGLAFALALLGSSCSGHDTPAECEEIGEACHAFDTGSGMAHDCHENAHEEWSAAECTANRAACLAVCGGGGDAGAPDAGAPDAAP